MRICTKHAHTFGRVTWEKETQACPVCVAWSRYEQGKKLYDSVKDFLHRVVSGEIDRGRASELIRKLDALF